MNTATATRIPAPNQPWPEQGGIYVGPRVIKGVLHHVVTVDGGTAHDLLRRTFAQAKNAEFGEINGHSDWHAGDQEDVMLGVINCREHFQQTGDSIYWTRSEHHGYPWAVDFEGGTTGNDYRFDEFRVRPFRSFPDSSL